MRPTIGFIGQGWIGKNYADDFEERGFEVVRYGLEPEFAENKDRIKDCDIVFVAVPTPTRPTGFDASIVESVLSLIGEGKIAVIKSTILPGTTQDLQNTFPNIAVIHSPEFLVSRTAAHDARNPQRNIIGVTDVSRDRAQEVMDVLPRAPFEKVMDAHEAELVKYANNGWLTSKVLFMNSIYDACEAVGANYEVVKEAFSHDPRIGKSHLDVIFEDGRGAGGHCFIKDLAALRELHGRSETNEEARLLLEALERYNKHLLRSTGKSIEQLNDVYGE